MRMTRDGNSFLTTPVYIGSNKDIAYAALCTHEFAPSNEPLKAEGKAMFQMERCRRCCAIRARVTPAAGFQIEDLA